MEKQPMELTGDFEAALDMLEKTNKNLFITGRAGTGKSTLLSLFKNTTRKKSVVLACRGKRFIRFLVSLPN
jgi:ATP-dependent DNA helicase PIF1